MFIASVHCFFFYFPIIRLFCCCNILLRFHHLAFSVFKIFWFRSFFLSSSKTVKFFTMLLCPFLPVQTFIAFTWLFPLAILTLLLLVHTKGLVIDSLCELLLLVPALLLLVMLALGGVVEIKNATKKVCVEVFENCQRIQWKVQ